MKNTSKTSNQFWSEFLLKDPSWAFDRILDSKDQVFSDRYGRYEISEKDSSVNLEIALPGVSKEDISINVKRGIIKVEVKENQERKWVKSYQNSFSMGNSLDPDKIEAKVENGILSVEIKKKKDSEGKKIEIC